MENIGAKETLSIEEKIARVNRWIGGLGEEVDEEIL